MILTAGDPDYSAKPMQIFIPALIWKSLRKFQETQTWIQMTSFSKVKDSTAKVFKPNPILMLVKLIMKESQLFQQIMGHSENHLPLPILEPWLAISSKCFASVTSSLMYQLCSQGVTSMKKKKAPLQPGTKLTATLSWQAVSTPNKNWLKKTRNFSTW